MKFFCLKKRRSLEFPDLSDEMAERFYLKQAKAHRIIANRFETNVFKTLLTVLSIFLIIMPTGYYWKNFSPLQKILLSGICLPIIIIWIFLMYKNFHLSIQQFKIGKMINFLNESYPTIKCVLKEKADNDLEFSLFLDYLEVLPPKINCRAAIFTLLEIPVAGLFFLIKDIVEKMDPLSLGLLAIYILIGMYTFNLILLKKFSTIQK